MEERPRRRRQSKEEELAMMMPPREVLTPLVQQSSDEENVALSTNHNLKGDCEARTFEVEVIDAKMKSNETHLQSDSKYEVVDKK